MEIKRVTPEQAKELPDSQGCQKGMRSMKAAELLINAGFSDVVDMRGGSGGPGASSLCRHMGPAGRSTRTEK